MVFYGTAVLKKLNANVIANRYANVIYRGRPATFSSQLSIRAQDHFTNNALLIRFKFFHSLAKLKLD